MSYISLAEANAWADKYKLNLTSVDAELEESLATQVLARVSSVYDTSSWVSPVTTPALIRKIIAMQYVGWLFQRTYSEEEEVNNYGMLLIGQADSLLEGIDTGALVLPEVEVPSGVATLTEPVFYPNDLSSAQEPTADDSSLGDARFSMGTVF